MCLAIPMKVIEKTGNNGKVQAGNVTYDANFTLIPDVLIGEYVLIHAGFAIEKLDVVEAEKTLDLFREMYDNQDD
ncbi:MAG: HypC/HybG/HupF family hydrogenase formation chaperone [Spirochaetales bacterium]|nr:HypC/HybG/HupF family hydrogenase formation chaperone [Spirochaetales bacterium]